MQHAEELQQLWDEALKAAAENRKAGYKNAAYEGGVRYAWGEREGVANKRLEPITGELRASLLSSENNIIVNSHEKVVEIVNDAFNNPAKHATAFFGVINPDVLKEIQDKATNVKKEQKGNLFKDEKGYCIAAGYDSIRHLNENGKLSRGQIIELLDRMSDIIIENDAVMYSEYVSRKQKVPGLRFEKTFEDGTYASYELISGRRQILGMQTMYIEGRESIIKETLHHPAGAQASSFTSETGGAQVSGNNISQGTENINNKNSVEDTVSDRDLLLEAAERPGASEELRRFAKKQAELERLQRRLEKMEGETRAVEDAGPYEGEGRIATPPSEARNDSGGEALNKVRAEIEKVERQLDKMERGAVLQREVKELREQWFKQNAAEAVRVQREIQRENRELREAVDFYKEQVKLTPVSERRVRPQDVARFARALLKEHESSADLDAVREKLQAIGDYLVSGDGINGREYRNACREVARLIADEQYRIVEDGGVYEELRSLVRI